MSIRVVHLLKATGIAGAEGHLLALLPALRGFGVESQVLLLGDPRHPPYGLRDRVEAAGAAFSSIPINWHIDPSLPFRLISTLRAHDFDILHAHLPHAEVYGELAMRAFPMKKFILSRHNDDRFRRWLPAKWAFAPSLRRADAIIAISRAVERFLIEVEKAPAEKIVCIPYGIDSAGFAKGGSTGKLRQELGLSAEPIALFIGRLTRQKGVDVLLQAFALAGRSLPDAHLVIAGDGPERKNLQWMTRKLNLRYVHFLGWRHDTADLLADADVFVMPSRWEGFGLVALEAMAMAKPVIASRVSALPEIIVDDKTGILLPPEESCSLSEAMVWLLANREKAKAFGLAGQARVQSEFTVAKMAERTAMVYKRR